MRLFVAVDLTEDMRKKAAEIMNQLKGLDIDVKFVEPQNLHFTLKFIGEVDEGHVNEIEKSVSDAVRDFKPFKVSVEGLGYFGNPSHIKTIWIDTRQGREELVNLAKRMDIVLDHVRREARGPKPHITIGRAKSGRNRDALLSFIKKNKHVKLGYMDVKVVCLKQSVLSREGPHYTDLKVFGLE